MKHVLLACVILVVSVDPIIADDVHGSPKPNVVVILADDLGYGDLGCYGSKVSKTPHIDKLAAAGVRFTDFHSAGPMCTPTRAAMLTGQYQQRFGPQFDSALSGLDDRKLGLPHEAVTLAELFRDQDYATACFGKWHLGYRPPWLPVSQGFDTFRGLASGDGDHHTHIDRSGHEDWWHNNRIKMESGYTADLLTRYSIEFIEAHRDDPFFLYVPHLAIHFPWQGPSDPPHRKPGRSYHNDKWGIIPDRANVQPHVTAMIESLDKSVGAIVETLKKLNLDKNTIVIFTSDNGGYLTYGKDFKNISSNGPLRGQKGSLYEGGHRVPAVISWPGKIKPAVTDATAHSVDLLPTLAALANVPLTDTKTDGINLAPLLQEGKTPAPRLLYWRKGSDRAVRSGPWKLCFTAKRAELYNLADDIGETNDLAAMHPEKVQRLTDAWEDWEADVNRSAARFTK